MTNAEIIAARRGRLGAGMMLRGDALSMLRTLPSDSVQCIVTSPPYWALRRYDIPDIVFDGDPGCDHDFAEKRQRWSVSATCAQCGAWRGQLGQEPTPDLFIAHLVEIFREVRRVLRSDGTCWLNMGDCYSNADKGGYQCSTITAKDSLQASNLASDFIGTPNRQPQTGLKNKDLVGIPWMLAFALRADGWYLRSEIVWAKGLSFCPSYAGSVMPESVTDRPTRSHEQVFLLTKNSSYYYDHEAVKEQAMYPAGTRATTGFNERYFAPDDDGYATYDGTRNLRTVWAIGVEPFTDAHFATFPPALVDPCLRAGTSQKGACTACGAPWERIVEYEPMPAHIKAQFEAARTRTGEDHGRDDGFTTRRPRYTRKRTSETWRPTCECHTPEVVPCTVLDPFAGSGTTGVVAERLQLQFIGIDLGYHEMSARRIAGVAPLFSQAETEPV